MLKIVLIMMILMGMVLFVGAIDLEPELKPLTSTISIIKRNSLSVNIIPTGLSINNGLILAEEDNKDKDIQISYQLDDKITREAEEEIRIVKSFTKDSSVTSQNYKFSVQPTSTICHPYFYTVKHMEDYLGIDNLSNYKGTPKEMIKELNISYCIFKWVTEDGVIKWNTYSENLDTNKFYDIKVTNNGFERILGDETSLSINDVIKVVEEIYINGSSNCSEFYEYLSTNVNNCTTWNYSYSEVNEIPSVQLRCDVILNNSASFVCRNGDITSGSSVEHPFINGHQMTFTNNKGFFYGNNTIIDVYAGNYLFLDNVKTKSPFSYTFQPIDGVTTTSINATQGFAYSSVQAIHNQTALFHFLVLTNGTLNNSRFHNLFLAGSPFTTSYIKDWYSTFTNTGGLFPPVIFHKDTEGTTFECVNTCGVFFAVTIVQDFKKMKFISNQADRALFMLIHAPNNLINVTDIREGSLVNSIAWGLGATTFIARKQYTQGYRFTDNGTNSVNTDVECHSPPNINLNRYSASDVTSMEQIFVRRYQTMGAETYLTVDCNFTNGTTHADRIDFRIDVTNTHNDTQYMPPYAYETRLLGSSEHSQEIS